MSKTTTTLFSILLIFIAIFLYVLLDVKQNPIITSLTQSASIPTTAPNTSLSLATTTQSAQNGQTITAAVLIQNLSPDIALAQLEIAYDPLIITIDDISPGTFFTNPTIVLQKIDPVAGRISFALRCPANETTNAIENCINITSPTVARITMTISPYTAKNVAELSFLPKTVIRIHTGKDILQQIKGLRLTISNPNAIHVNTAPQVTHYIHSAPRR
ncbi:MAG TPA: cohesin domain-containing protein [Candidatus Sulfotelmatobacter sp.]|jgi:hypothetical protein|nr:cohesin domain-containing protein [Candidatus Sulfotelmatobacter sp.]